MARRNQFVAAISRGLAQLQKAVVPVTVVPGYAVSGGSQSLFGGVREPYSGAWQAGVAADSQSSLLAFGAVFACLKLIAGDISKLRIKLVERRGAIWQEIASPSFSPVLRKPNRYQTRIQFLEQWVLSKLIHGNTYVLKDRDARGIVVAMYVLDATRVKAMVTDDGQVWYQIGTDRLVGELNSFTVPASEIIHDRGLCLFHPLIGVSPIYACGISATQGNRIQANSAKFFQNMSQPGGMLTSPSTIDDATAVRLKTEFETKFSGSNVGRLFVGGDGLKYEAFTIPAQQSQLIEQLRWTVEDVCRAFGVPMHKIASDAGEKFSNIAAKSQDYYSQTLQVHIEAIEVLLDEGLALPPGYGTELDLDGLLRMDPVQRAEVNERGVKSGIVAPNEARAAVNLPPTEGGDEPLVQMQDVRLSSLGASTKSVKHGHRWVNAKDHDELIAAVTEARELLTALASR